MMYNQLFALGWTRREYWEYRDECTHHHEIHAVENLAEIGESV